MNRSIPYLLVLLAIVLWTMLVPAACQKAPVSTPFTIPPPTSNPTRTATPVRPTLTPSQTPTGTLSPTPRATQAPSKTPAITLPPTQYFANLSQNWKAAFYIESSRQICVITGDGSERVCLDLNEENFSNGYPSGGFLALSPDGNEVAYATECNIYIWTIGEAVTPLRNGQVCGIFRELEWSPDGNFIVYISEELERFCINCQAVFGDVFIDSLDGKIHRALTTDLLGWSYDPVWSPEGKNISFTLRRVFQQSQDNHISLAEEIYIVSVGGEDAINLTNHSARDVRPRWSPDGKLIAFLSDRGGSELFDLYLMNSDGSDVRKVADLALNYIWPYSSYPLTWLPDGKFFLYHDTLVNTVNGKKEQISLPFVSIYASWAMTAEKDAVSAALTPTPAFTSTPHCADGWSQLSPGIQAVVSGDPNDPPNRVRSAPITSTEILVLIFPGHQVQILGGPICADGLVFWKVESDAIPGGEGWTAEGDGTEYWLEPYQQ